MWRRGYGLHMPDIPSAVPDKAKIRALIHRRGDTISDFAREIGVHRDKIWDITSRTTPRPVAIRTLKPIARGLRVKLSDISDWDGDDIDLEPKALAS
jgi:transcriptional regulator with XRE-family HTH domain